jgi:hypothetical protein
MRQLIFALQFRGSATPVPGAEGKLTTKTSARSQVHRTSLGAAGVHAALESGGGGSATFELEVQMTGEGTFVESGTITYGAAGKVTFKTVGHGVLGPSGIEGLQRGAVIWEVTGGAGRFAGATGLITSNFTVSAQGQVVDNHFASLFLPSEARPEKRSPGAKDATARSAKIRTGRKKEPPGRGSDLRRAHVRL